MRIHLLLILLIMISGCVSLPGTSSGGGIGLALGSLSFSPQKVNNNQLTKLSMDVENSGNFDITDAYLYLFKLPMSDTDWTISDGEMSQTFSLLAPAVRGGKSYGGEARTFQWILRAPPKLPRDEVFSFKAGVRACYTYKTVVSGKLEVISESEWLNNEPKQHPIDIVQSRGPLKIDMISTQPIITSISSASETKIKIRVTNAGDGTVTNNDCARFQASGNSADFENEINMLNKITIGTSDCTFSEDIYLQKGQFREVIITCTPPPGDAPIRTDNFQIEMNYNYYVDREATVNVVGTESEVIAGGGGAPVSAITLKDPCTSACKATGQGYLATQIGICADTSSSTIKYPGTTVDVVINPLESSALGAIGSITTGTTSATIKSLGLHDVTVEDTNLQEMTLGVLDTKANSAEYEKNTKLKRADVGLIKGICDSTSSGQTLTHDGKTAADLCPTALGSEPLSNIININGAPGSEFKNNALPGIRITSLINRDVSSLTGGNVTSISLEEFKVSAVSSYLSNAPVSSSGEHFLQYLKCESKNTISSGPSSLCQCVMGVSGTAYSAYTPGTTSAACTAACPRTVGSTTWANGGECKENAAYGTTQCKGTVTYDYFSRPSAPGACTAPSVCLCYRTKTISATEAALVCR